MAELFTTQISPIFTAAMGWLGEISNAVTENNVIGLFVFIPVAFLGVNFFRKLLRL